MMKQYARLGLILAAFSVIACVGLAFVYAGTKDQIAANQGKQLNESLKAIFPEAAEFKNLADMGAELKLPGDSKLISAFEAMKDGLPLGLAIQASGPSYGGPVTLLVGVGIDRRITGVRILSSLDTPGLGLNATNPSYYVDKKNRTTFPGQFTGKPTTDPFVVKQDVAAITASTISSKAITTVIKASADAGQSWLEQNSFGGAK
jgi:electron transport complex protein RnfG